MSSAVPTLHRRRDTSPADRTLSTPGPSGRPSDDVCYRAVSSRDVRFDGRFVTAVHTTGIYCRPSCPARTPFRRNVTFYASAAGAQHNGYRACKRCRPDASPGSPEWDVRADVVARALRYIADGVVDRDGVPGLARRLGYSERQLGRALSAELGAGPLALARTRRAQIARTLLETSDLPAADVAFAAGFASVRQFNATVREIYALSPTQLRARRRTGPTPVPGVLELRLPYRAPFAAAYLLDFLGAHAVEGVERWDGTQYSRTLDLPHGAGHVSIRRPEDDTSTYLLASLSLVDQRDLAPAVARVRHLFDLDADPEAVDDVLATVPGLRAGTRRRPGLRSPGCVDGFELAVRTIVGQQVSLAGARRVLARIVAEHGATTAAGDRLFPTAQTLAALEPERLPIPRARGRAVIAVARVVADGDLDLGPGADREQTRFDLLALPGIGPWTADYVRMRALRDPDVLLGSDLIVRRLLAQRGMDPDAADGAPWRSYVTHHLWADFLDAAHGPVTVGGAA